MMVNITRMNILRSLPRFQLEVPQLSEEPRRHKQTDARKHRRPPPSFRAPEVLNFDIAGQWRSCVTNMRLVGRNQWIRKITLKSATPLKIWLQRGTPTQRPFFCAHYVASILNFVQFFTNFYGVILSRLTLILDTISFNVVSMLKLKNPTCSGLEMESYNF